MPMGGQQGQDVPTQGAHGVSEKGSCKKEGLKEAVGIPCAHVGLCFST